ncbi:hypothetical protein GGI04_002597 [Coemansia thaxteri]|uniref:6,7-dimethyl-8-ribityllumazine synthase n=1 Tax=Coemansia thaxteri TaxID=2663907 RepID=A0A9W8EEL5_9FUNG|nr:hypothetical protein H4R26_003445 [Coemansia thaxteri]KAJ2004466.1 hypothetical protein GGI04_002597 [Coemansia thaxteri]KAJ2472530.1 hypothetical protein GGI02_001519 [Coemansia sp. RSA 2322]KAJ2477695.1 hypothetical protein EV174_004538 [Coemansia sp. RSA 2320]
MSKSNHVPLVRRDLVYPEHWSTNRPKVHIVFSVEHFDIAEKLVNDLRYELVEKHKFSPLNIRLTQAESIHEIPLYIARVSSRSDIVYAVGVELESEPTHEPRLLDLLTRRIDALTVKGCLPVFDCILVRQSRDQLLSQIQALEEQGSTLAATWARRGVDTYTALSRH